MVKKTVSAFSKIVIAETELVFVLHLAIFYFRLGLFLLLIWLAGLFFAFFITKGYRAEHRKIVAIPLILFGYVLSVFIVWNVFVDQKSQRTFQMTWTDKGSGNEHKQSEVVLRFVDYPHHYIGIVSSDLANYLKTYSKNEVPVVLEVTSDFWCERGFYTKQIGERTQWKSVSGYSGEEGSATEPSPWPKRWWCP